MLRGYRGIVTTLAGLAVVGFTLWALIADLSSVDTAYTQAATDASVKYERYSQAYIEERCISPTGLRELDCTAKAQEAAREGQRKEQDLAAQNITAWWTKVMGVAALIGMTLSAVGVWLVKTTFAETRRSNEIASDTAKKQLRAYVNISSARGGNFGPDRIPRFDLEAKNTGVTPAIDFRADVEFYLLPAKELPPTEIPDISAYRSQILGAGQPAPSTPKLDRAISDNEWAQLVSGDLKAFYTFYAEYTDIFGDSHKFGMHGYVSGLPDKLDVMPIPGSVIFT